MRTFLRSLSCLVFTSTVIGGVLAAGPATVAGASATGGAATCSGTPKAPGTLAGTFNGSVVVKGACQVNAGPAVINGDLTLSPGSALLAVFALNDQAGTGKSSLTVKGNVLVRSGATLLMGCNPANFPCLDDPDQSNPTLSMHPTVGLDLRSNLALGVIVHNFTVGGDVIQTGGGGGVNCQPQGIFKLFQSPAYSTYEVGSVGGDVRISSVHSCWMGVVEMHVGNTVVMYRNKLADPDAIELLSNNITGNLICRGNSATWDNADTGPNLFPRQPAPNTVGRNRKGQCVLSSPNTRSDKPGPGPF